MFAWADNHKDHYGGVAGMNGTDLDDHYFSCFEATSIASLVILIETEASVLDNGSFGSAMLWAWNIHKATLKRHKSDDKYTDVTNTYS